MTDPKPKTALVKVVPLTDVLSMQFDAVQRYPLENSMTAKTATEFILALLAGTKARDVREMDGRAKYETLEGYISEIPLQVILRISDILAQCIAVKRWRDICGGNGRALLEWTCKRYPVLYAAWTNAEKMRIAARADKTLDGLELIFEKQANGEHPQSAVKAAEILLRATHPAFGHVTEAKTGTDRTTVNIQINFADDENGTRKSRKDAITANYTE